MPGYLTASLLQSTPIHYSQQHCFTASTTVLQSVQLSYGYNQHHHATAIIMQQPTPPCYSQHHWTWDLCCHL